MTVQEAIEWIKAISAVQKESIHKNSLLQRKEALHIAIEALEKQIPYKPQEYEDKYYACKCGNNLLLKWEKYPTKLMPKSKGLPRCLVCGQKLDWGG